MPTKAEFEAALKKVQRAQMSHKRSSTQTTDYEKARREFLPNVAAGSAAGFVGAPVDLVNMALQAFGRGTDKPVMGSNWIGDKLKANIDSPGFAVGQFLDPGAMSHAAISVAPALAGIIKANKGAHWFPEKGKPHPVDDALQVIGSRRWKSKEDLLESFERHPYDISERRKQQILDSFDKDQAVNNWIDNKLSSYMKKRLGTENDEIRKLAEKNILHYSPEELYGGDIGRLERSRRKAGFPEKGIAKTELGKRWEDNADSGFRIYKPDTLINPDQAEVYDAVSDLNYESNLPITRGIQDTIKNGSLNQQQAIDIYKQGIYNEWEGQELIPDLFFNNRDAPVYDMGDETPFNLGFNHLVDEMGNLLDPRLANQPDWPKDLILTPEQVNSMSVEDMVKKVDKVNKHREKMAIAAKRKANERFANLESVHSFDDGSRLVELPDPTTSDEAMDLVRNCGENGKWCTQGRGMAERYGSGNNRLMVLFDKDNNPVAQMTKTTAPRAQPNEFLANNHPERWNEIQDKLYDGLGTNTKYSFNELGAQTPEYQEYLKQPEYRSITELKGYDNEYVRPEHGANLAQYLKQGDWQSIADADSLGLQRYGQRYMSNEDAIRNPEFIDYMINSMDWDGNTEDLLRYQSDKLPKYWNDWQNSLLGGGI